MSLFIHNEGMKEIVKKYPVNTSLIVILSLVYLLTIFTGGFTGQNLYELGAMHNASVEAGEYYRLVFSMFLHGSTMHFIMNTFFGIAILGIALEKLIGSIKYAIVYFVSGLTSSLLIYFVNNHAGFTVGASGAIYGVLGVFLFIILFMKEILYESERQYLVGLIIINAVATFIFPNVSRLGHIGGLIAGFILGFIFLFNRWRRKRMFR
jgi:rhomboid protease GluP